MEIIYKDLSHRIVGCVFDVFREIGPGFDEFTYHQGLKVRFEMEDLPFSSKPHIQLFYRNVQIAELEPDFIEIDYWLINGHILFAVLAGSKQVRAYDIMRMRSYLKKLKLNFGLITFWGKDHLKILVVSSTLRP